MAHFSHAIMNQVREMGIIFNQMESIHHELSLILVKRVKVLGEQSINNLYKQAAASFVCGAAAAGFSFAPLFNPAMQAPADALGKTIQAGDRVLGTLLNAGHSKSQIEYNTAKDIELQRSLKLQEELKGKNSELQGLVREVIRLEADANKNF